MGKHASSGLPKERAARIGRPAKGPAPWIQGAGNGAGLHDAVLARLFVLLLLGSAHVELGAAEGQEDGRGHVDGRVGADDDADQHGEGKGMDDAATQDEEGQGGRDGGAG